MPGITIRVLDGSDRGRVFADLRPPVTVGREEGNDVQLNDERVSRFHLKIQEDNERLVLTDLESTNGTKVNGEDSKLRILRFGDLISVGRSVLLIGSREEIAHRWRKLKNGDRPAESHEGGDAVAGAGAGGDFDLNLGPDDDLQAKLYQLEPPELPSRMTPGQAAQLAEVLDYLHIRLRELIRQAQVDNKGERVVLDLRMWQTLVDMQARLSEYLRRVSDPNAEV